MVGTAGPEAVQLITDIKQVSDDILENNARFLTTSDTGGGTEACLLLSLDETHHFDASIGIE